MYKVDPCGCVRDANGAIVPPMCGSRRVHNAQWAEALRESSRIRRKMVATALSFGGPQDGLAREAAEYGIVPIGEHRAVPAAAHPNDCRICGDPTRSWPDGRFPIHASV